MAKQTINVGVTANDGTGSTIRAGGQIINSNFTEIYNAVGDGSTISFDLSGATNGQALVYNSSTGKFEPGTASVSSDFIVAGDGGVNQTISSNDTLTVQGGTGITTTGVATDTLSIAIDGTVATLTGSQVLTGKTINTASNTITIVEADISDLGSYITATSSDTLTNKTIDSANNTLTLDLSEGTLTGTTAEFNTALSDGSFATLAGTETLTNKTINSASNTITITESNISDLGAYITASSTATLTNKTFDANGTGNSISNIETADFASAAFKDEDNMASDSATAVASQQSIKAYVDAEDANIASDSLTFTNKSGAISQWSNDTGYLVNTVEDTTPQLGGDLDLNSNNITGTGA